MGKSVGDILWFWYIPLGILSYVFSDCQASSTNFPNFNCGNYSGIVSGPGVISDEIIPWNAPYTRRLLSTNDATYPAILVAPSLILLSTTYLIKDGDKDTSKSRIYDPSTYFATPGSHFLGDPVHFNLTYLKTIGLTHFRFHPDYKAGLWPTRENHLVLGHLKEAVDSPYAEPICLPSLHDAGKQPKPGERLIISGWIRDVNDKNAVLRLRVLENDVCLKFWESIQNETLDNPFGDQWCATASSGSENLHESCIHRDVGAYKLSNGRLFLAGIVNELFSKQVNNETTRKCTEGAMVIFKPLINTRTVQWILDNIDCGPQQFTCSDGSCTDLKAICNRSAECLDASDEDPQYCQSINYCRPDEFRCSSYGPCISRDKFQDGVKDCEFGEDEIGYSRARPYLLPLVISVSVILILGATVFAGFFFRKNKILRNEIRTLTENEIQLFREGEGAEKNPYWNTAETDGGNLYGRLYEQVSRFPWDPQLEISYSDITKRKELNRGNFGIVYEGSFCLSKSASGVQIGIPVAIKTQKDGVTAKEFKQMYLREIKMLAYVGDHPNVLKFYGACTEKIESCEVYMVIELCENGDLLEYLRQHVDCFVNLDDPQEVRRVSIISSEYKFSNYQYGRLDTFDLVCWASGAASGMQYLASKGVIHGDLAARNLLLTSTLNLKISDFGLSKMFDESGVYKKSSKVPGPWKWMAPEAVSEAIFSEKSDVWSFGVVLYEMFTLGEMPYPNDKCLKTLMNDIRCGRRLSQPSMSSDEIYSLMQDCWARESGDRPTFSVLKESLSDVLARYKGISPNRNGSVDSGHGSSVEYDDLEVVEL